MHEFGIQGTKPEGKEWERSAGICQGPEVLLRLVIRKVYITTFPECSKHAGIWLWDFPSSLSCSLQQPCELGCSTQVLQTRKPSGCKGFQGEGFCRSREIQVLHELPSLVGRENGDSLGEHERMLTRN